MIKGKYFYILMLLLAAGFIVYVTYTNFIYDPKATEFLSKKIDVMRPIHIPIWLNVMHVHVIFACIAIVTGIVNFSNWTYQNYRKFHRINGYAYLISVIVVVITSGYMAPYSTGGKVNSIAFNLLNIIWPALTFTALVKIKKKQVNKHRKWMVRSYALCYTNMFIHLITFVCHDGFHMAYSLSYMIGVYGTIPVLFILAEIVIRIIYKIPAD